MSTEQQKNSGQLDSLKLLGKLLVNGGEMSTLVSNISKSKRALESFCKSIKLRENELQANEKVELEKKVVIDTEKVVKSEKPVQEKEDFSALLNQLDEKTNQENKVTKVSNEKPVVESKTAAPEVAKVTPTEVKSNSQVVSNNGQVSAKPNNYQQNNYQSNNSNSQQGGYQGNRTFQNNQNNGYNRDFNNRGYNNNRPNDNRNYQKPFSTQNTNSNYNGQRFDRNAQSTNPQNGNGFTPRNNFQSRPPYNNQNGTRPNFNNANGTRPPFNQNRPGQFNRPFGQANGQNGTGLKPARVTGLLPRADRSETIVAKPERQFGNKNKTKPHDAEKKELNVKAKMRMGYIDVNEDFEDEDNNERVIGRMKSTKPKKQKEIIIHEKTVIDHAIITTDNLTVKMLAEKIGKPANDLIKKFMMLGMMPNVNSVIDFQTAELVAGEFGVTLEQKLEQTYEDQLQEIFDNQSNSISNRPPIVTVMGHVDHGKTMLLDTIRKTNVIAGEAGGITQHIGAYSVEINGHKITFIDTPGHEAFTSMRARGAKITDVAILVVAADDGIMPQTVEAINHIKAAKVPMLVAINKVDKPEANIERIKQQLTEYDIIPEEWGGDTICVPISAKFNQNIDKLLEMVLLVSEMADLRADKSVKASGHILESKIDKGRGIITNVIIKNGTLHIGDFIISGVSTGRVRAMIDCNGKSVAKAEPSMAVSVLGFTTVPEAGDLIYVVDEKMAKNIVDERTSKLQIEKSKHNSGISLEDFLAKSADSETKTLNIIIKADVNGSAEALKQSLEKIKNDEVSVSCIHSSVGGINESDVLLAQASNAIIIGFNVRPEAKAKALAEKNSVDIKLYRIIYDAVDDVTKAINGMLAPKFEEVVTGHIEVRQIFKISSIGVVAGSYVTDGTISNKSKIRLLRNNVVIFETDIDTLQQAKNEVKEVRSGFECGIKLKNYNDIKVGDTMECYEVRQIKNEDK